MTFEIVEPSAVALAAKRVSGVVNRTPVMTSRTLNEWTGFQVFFKCENFQRVGAFKFRGAYNAVSQLNADQKATGVITHSSGNHAQGLALAAKLHGVKATIVMPDDAPAIKRAATAGYGAEIVSCAAIDREKVCAELVARHGYTLIHPYDNDHIIAGAGTAAWELFEEIGPLDTLFVPVGGGGLISGSALAAAALSPGCRVVGVEPQSGDDAGCSWRTNKVHRLDHVPETIADGLRTRFVGERNLRVMHRYVADMTSVSEEEILEALKFLWVRMKILVEPSSAVALAPLLAGRYADSGQRIGVLLSGGNVDIAALSKIVYRQEVKEPTTITLEEEEDKAEETKRPRVLVVDRMAEEGLRVLLADADVIVKHSLSHEELLREIGNYQGLVVGRNRQIDEQLIEYGFDLRAIGNLSSRLDNVDVSTARNMGVEVFPAATSRAVAIAEHTMSRLLELAGTFGDGSLAGKTLALVGFGRAGREVAQRALAFEMKVFANQPRLTPQLAISQGVEEVDLERLLPQADFVSLHVPFKRETDAVIGAKELALMKHTACLINTGYTDLVDERALLLALENGQIEAAALSSVPPEVEQGPLASLLRQHPKVIVSPHVSSIIHSTEREMAISVAKQVVAALRTTRASETLSLDIVPIEQVIPHEDIDDKRVDRLAKRLLEDGRLVNPPVTVLWGGQYIVLDGATRYSALKKLGFPYIVVQLVKGDQSGFALHTWYHAICGDRPFLELQQQLESIEHLKLSPLPGDLAQEALRETNALCYLLDRDGDAMLAQVESEGDRLTVLREIVSRYTAWGSVERTLLTDVGRLRGQFSQLAAVAVFPQLRPEVVFEVACKGGRLPAGMTRFVIPGRILRLNADLERLTGDEPLAAKRAWLNRFLRDKLIRRRMRYYQEPIILLDE